MVRSTSFSVGGGSTWPAAAHFEISPRTVLSKSAAWFRTDSEVFCPALENVLVISYHCGSVLGMYRNRARVTRFIDRFESIIEPLHIMLVSCILELL